MAQTSTPQKPSAVKSKAVKPRSVQRASQPLSSIPEQRPVQVPTLQTQVHTGLVNLAVARMKDEVVADPAMPDPTAGGDCSDNPESREEQTAEIYIQEEQEQAGTMHTDLALQSEQRAMQELHRLQKLSLQAMNQPDTLPLPLLQSIYMPCYPESGPWHA